MKTLSSSTKIALSAVLVLAIGGGLYLADPALFGAGGDPSTDDAYVKADITLVAPKVGGFVTEVLVDDNETVKAGQLLARIDDRDFKVALDAARAGLEAAVADQAHAEASLAQQQAVIAQARANVRAGEADVTFARQELDRYTRLARKGAGSVQNEQQARSKIDSARAHLAFDKAALEAAQHQMGVLQAARDKAVSGRELAQAQLDKAKLNLAYTRITAPIDGIVGRRGLRLGAFVSPGSPLLAIVPVSDAYVVANFRETQLAGVQPGQAVQIRVDSLPGVRFSGRVDSIAPATGLEFAPVHPSNATGNFTKVVQRIPVKIAFEPNQPGHERLRAGMSVVATVETGAAGAEAARRLAAR